jgi:hypothetical protein
MYLSSQRETRTNDGRFDHKTLGHWADLDVVLSDISIFFRQNAEGPIQTKTLQTMECYSRYLSLCYWHLICLCGYAQLCEWNVILTNHGIVFSVSIPLLQTSDMPVWLCATACVTVRNCVRVWPCEWNVILKNLWICFSVIIPLLLTSDMPEWLCATVCVTVLMRCYSYKP